ncbi:MAG TPA: hypothetical protein VHN99_06595 [Deinococcales bacterium]|nr:hypothetical protein [Deinococcales bacterium]
MVHAPRPLAPSYYASARLAFLARWPAQSPWDAHHRYGERADNAWCTTLDDYRCQAAPGAEPEALVLAALADGPATAASLQARTGLSKSRTYQALEGLAATWRVWRPAYRLYALTD